MPDLERSEAFININHSNLNSNPRNKRANFILQFYGNPLIKLTGTADSIQTIP